MRLAVEISCDGYETESEYKLACIALIESLNSAGCSTRVLEIDLDTLEAKCHWQSEMLERATQLVKSTDDSLSLSECVAWFTDLEKGPQ